MTTLPNGSVDALAADGGIVTIRPVQSGDRKALAGLYGDASPDSLRLRFFGQPFTAALAAEVDRLCRPETDQHLAVLAEEAGKLVGVALLTGYHGTPPVDTAALEDLLLRLGRQAEDRPEVAELDLNPVLAGPDGVAAVDAKLRLAPVGAEPDPTLRRLRAADRS